MFLGEARRGEAKGGRESFQHYTDIFVCKVTGHVYPFCFRVSIPSLTKR